MQTQNLPPPPPQKGLAEGDADPNLNLQTWQNG